MVFDKNILLLIVNHFLKGETVEFGGKVISHLATNPKLMKYSARIVTAADYALKYDIRGIDGRVIPSHREFRTLGPMLPRSLRFLNKYVPGSFKVPQFVLDIASTKYASLK